MTIYDMTEEEREKLREVPLEDLELSVRSYNLLKRAGYINLRDLACVTRDELAQTKRMRPRVLEEVLGKLAQRGVFLLTDQDKKLMLKMDDVEFMRCEVRLLQERLEKTKEQLSHSQQENKRLYETYKAEKDEERASALEEAKGLMADSEYPMESVLERMYFGKSSIYGCGFCTIFDLWDKGCLMESNASDESSLDHCCEKCIREFLKDYYK